ncbi:hypothetical protein HY994_04965 [Candidatus Micrarchaeota archaeon]|nr:hypothetical protein [Candidatus Micrarchaeota archaeon]
MESMVLLGGLFAFVAVIGAASWPLQEAAMQNAQELAAQSAFEKIRFSLEAASFSAPGFSMEQDVVLAQNATLSWNDTQLEFKSSALNRTWSGHLTGEKIVPLSAGVHHVHVFRPFDLVGSGVRLEVT